MGEISVLLKISGGILLPMLQPWFHTYNLFGA